MKINKNIVVVLVLIASIAILAKLINDRTESSHNEVVQAYLSKIDSLEAKILTIEMVSIPLADTIVRMEDVVAEIKKYNWRFPEVVLAQFILESTEFNSGLVKRNNNISGMKVAKQRVSIARAHHSNSYALYDNYKECIVDRALYEASYLRSIKSEESYIKALDNHYAEDGKYAYKLKKVIRNYKLKEMF